MNQEDDLEKKLRIGWHLNAKKIPCEIPSGKSLSNHTAIIAQSGAGKSFFLGRFIEELLLCTRSKVFIIDNNGDFRKFNEINSDLFDEKKGFGEIDKIRRDEKETWEDNWKNMKMKYFTKSKKGNNCIKPLIQYNKLSDSLQMATLGFNVYKNPDEVILLKDMINSLSINNKYYKYSDLFDNLNSFMEEKSESISSSVKNRFIFAIEELLKYEIFANNEDDKDITEEFNVSSENTTRALILDLPSLKGKKSYEAGMTLINACLLKLWENAFKQWEHTMSLKNKKDDKRVPFFIVLDEAHNFLTIENSDPLKVLIREHILKIVAEGRKYGIFLILATQRPSKIPEAILSETENVCIMRLNSIVERNKAHNIWGIPMDNLNQVAYFADSGDCILFGRWVPTLYAIHALPRRTLEGGANLNEETWNKPEDVLECFFKKKNKK